MSELNDVDAEMMKTIIELATITDTSFANIHAATDGILSNGVIGQPNGLTYQINTTPNWHSPELDMRLEIQLLKDKIVKLESELEEERNKVSPSELEEAKKALEAI